ncbi:MAG: hypothetical protein L3J71_15965 [Victivallaceae bacterium]|nr:hypothetical protein [Victivallaceae bacterium]
MSSLQEKISIHDRYQFELKYTYPLDHHNPVTEYTVESFLFIPNNLGINSGSYSQDKFYNDMQKYIRLKTPKMHLHAIIAGKNCPLKKINEAMDKLCSRPDDEQIVSEYIYHVKMFCSIAKSAVRDQQAYIEELLPSEDRHQIIELYLTHIEQLLASFRELKHLVYSAHVDKDISAFYAMADEYLSLLGEKYINRLILFINENSGSHSQEQLTCAVKFIKAEQAYRRDNHYPSVPERESDNEEVVYRQRILKKIMGSILFLKTSVKTEGRILEQIIAGFAAGLAMLFAAISMLLSQKFFADLTTSLLVVLVVSYIFKDRIKEFSRTYMVRWLRKYIYDYKTELRTAMDVKIGICRELFTFLTEADLSAEIVKIRNKDYLGQLDNGYAPENILYSKKNIKIFNNPGQRLFADMQPDGIIDIIRLNITHFIEKMDNPRKVLFVPDGDDKMFPVKSRSVYHLNLVLKYHMGKEIEHHKFRIVLSRSGIKRIIEIPITGVMHTALFDK